MNWKVAQSQAAEGYFGIVYFMCGAYMYRGNPWPLRDENQLLNSNMKWKVIPDSHDEFHKIHDGLLFVF